MTKIIVFIVAALALVGALTAVATRIYLSGVDSQIAADIAKANQNVAERRETDAQFDKMDAAAVCRDYGLKWVYIDGKSECR